MGGKSAESRQCVLFCLACLTLSGCALLDSPKAPPPAAAPAMVIIERLPPPPAPTPPPEPVEEPREVREMREADVHLQAAQQLMARGEYEGSLRETQKALLLAKEGAPADAAVFYMGLLHAHPNNSKKDNKKAIGFFTRVVKSYPESAWAEQAKIWIGVLDGLEKLKQVDLELEERKRDRTR
jgi:hypothetical protein